MTSSGGPQRAFRASALAGVALPLAGLAFVGFALIDLAARTRFTLPAAELWTMLALGLGGLVLFFTSLLFRVGGRQRELRASNEDLQREYHELERQTAALKAEKDGAEAVLEAVPGRLLLIDPTYRITGAFAGELAGVVPIPEDGGNVLNALRRLLPEPLFRAAREHLAALFDPAYADAMLEENNPLRGVEIALSERGAVALRRLDFTFRRCRDLGEIARVLVAIEDVTSRHERDRAAGEADRRKVRQFDLLLAITHVDPRGLERFIQTARERLGAVDEALRAADFAAAAGNRAALLRQRLDTVLRNVRDVRASAGLLRLDYFERRAAEYEAKVAELRGRAVPLGGDDFLALVLAQTEFRAELEELQTLRIRMAGVQRTARVLEEFGDDVTETVVQSATELAASHGKAVTVEADGFDTRGLSVERRLIVKDVLLELTRNAIAHGIEDPATREALGKPRTGTITIEPVPDIGMGSFGFRFRDDGRGLDPVRIKEKAIAGGLIDSERAAMIDDSELVGFIFSPEFTTAGSTNAESFRGMGLHVVKQRIVDECGGTIAIDAEAGAFCEFTFVLPTARLEAVAV